MNGDMPILQSFAQVESGLKPSPFISVTLRSLFYPLERLGIAAVQLLTNIVRLLPAWDGSI
jgi:hypothetical protein